MVWRPAGDPVPRGDEYCVPGTPKYCGPVVAVPAIVGSGRRQGSEILLEIGTHQQLVLVRAEREGEGEVAGIELCRGLGRAGAGQRLDLLVDGLLAETGHAP